MRVIHCHTAEPTLKKMPCDPLSCVDVAAVSTVCLADSAEQARPVSGDENQVDMVRHQAVGLSFDAV